MPEANSSIGRRYQSNAVHHQRAGSSRLHRWYGPGVDGRAWLRGCRMAPASCSFGDGGVAACVDGRLCCAATSKPRVVCKWPWRFIKISGVINQQARPYHETILLPLCVDEHLLAMPGSRKRYARRTMRGVIDWPQANIRRCRHLIH